MVSVIVVMVTNDVMVNLRARLVGVKDENVSFK